MPIYVALTLIVPSLLIFFIERIKLKDIISEFKDGDKKSIIIVCCSWGIMIITMLRAYQFGNVTVVVPLCALTVILNAIVGYFFLNEKDNLLRKIIAAVLIIISIILIKI